MSLIKKIFFSLFIVLAVGFATWAYLNLKNSKKPKVEALSVLPDNCLLYLNTNDFFELNKKINSQSLIADKLKLFGDVNTFCNTINAFDSVFTANSVLSEMIKKNTIHFALYEKNQSWLATFNIKRLGNQELIISALVKLLNAKETKKDIYEFDLNKRAKFYFTLNKGVAIISNTEETLDQSLNTATPKIQNNKQFIEFKNTLEENALLSIYIDHQLYVKSKAASKLNLSEFCNNGFSAGSIDLEPSQLIINGYLKPGDSEIASAFYDQKPQRPDFLNLLPNNTSLFKAYGFNSFEKLNKSVNKLSSNNNDSYWKLITDTALFNIESEFYQNAESYLVSFETKMPDQNFILLKIKDTVKTSEHLGYMSDSLFYQDSVIVYKLKTKGLKTPLKLFNTFFNLTTNYATIYNSHLLFSETKSELLEIVAKLVKGNLITQNESFNTYKNQNLSENFNYMVYISPNKNKEEIKTIFNFEIKGERNPFENFKHFSFSISNNTSNFKFRCELMNEAETVNKEQNVLWALTLNASATMPAQTFLNHTTKENELAIQDNNKDLYLINAKGTILWKKKLNEKISSKIFTVDIFKNNKYQLLFSSENYLHLIDRNGNYVQGYPVKLPSASTSELSVIDYDNDKDYRLFIACKNKTIYNYSIFGIKQEKFNPVRTEAEVNLPIQYAKVGLSDYLIAIDKEGKIYTFSRKGEGRIGLKNKTIENCSAFYTDATNNINSTYIIYVDDKNNLLNKISFSDKKVVEKLNTTIESASVKFIQEDDKKTTDIIITKPNAIFAYNLNGNLLFEKVIDSELNETDFYSSESQSLFLSFSRNKQELIIVDQLKQKTKSIQASALPLLSDLFNNNKKYMIVTNGNQINCVAL
jgi:hypothetical protein